MRRQTTLTSTSPGVFYLCSVKDFDKEKNFMRVLLTHHLGENVNKTLIKQSIFRSRVSVYAKFDNNVPSADSHEQTFAEIDVFESLN